MTTGEPRASSSDGEEVETPASGYSHAKTFPVIARLITSTNKESKQWAKRSDISALMVSDPESAQLVKRTSERQRRDSLITAGNMFDFWSKEMTHRTNQYLERFSRNRIDDETAYWDNTLGPVPDIGVLSVTESVDELTSFALEEYLENFLIDNWSSTKKLGREYDIFIDKDGKSGRQYPTRTGSIDILARSKDGKEWLVIELKRGGVKDATLGQIMRYMGHVKKELASPGETVRGVIIAKRGNEGTTLAVSMVQDIEFWPYKLSFSLGDDGGST